jgi:hypothetical protein
MVMYRLPGNYNMVEFISLLLIAFFLNFTIGYMLLSLFAFFRRALW